MNGVLAAVLTPFDAGGAPDAARLLRFCKWLLDNGCDGLAVFGTTGEGTSLTVDERERLIEALISGGIPPARLLPGVGCASIVDTARLARSMTRAGCAGVLALPPFYYKEVSDEGVYRCYAEIIERAGEDSLRLYLYHIPQFSFVPVRLPTIERLLRRYPRNVVGIKDSSGDWTNLKATLEAFAPSGFEIFTGTEKLLLQALRLGGAGTITAMANVASREIAAAYLGWQKPDAEELQRAADVARASIRPPVIPALKAIIAERFGDEGWRRVRPPLIET